MTSSHNGPYHFAGPATILGVLTANLDGDSEADEIYSVVAPSDDAPWWEPHYLLARLSSRPGDLVVLSESTFETFEAVAAIDLNDDGRDEIVVSSPRFEGYGSWVSQYRNGKLESTGLWECGE